MRVLVIGLLSSLFMACNSGGDSKKTVNDGSGQGESEKPDIKPKCAQISSDLEDTGLENIQFKTCKDEATYKVDIVWFDSAYRLKIERLLDGAPDPEFGNNGISYSYLGQDHEPKLQLIYPLKDKLALIGYTQHSFYNGNYGVQKTALFVTYLPFDGLLPQGYFGGWNWGVYSLGQNTRGPFRYGVPTVKLSGEELVVSGESSNRELNPDFNISIRTEASELSIGKVEVPETCNMVNRWSMLNSVHRRIEQSDCGSIEYLHDQTHFLIPERYRYEEEFTIVTDGSCLETRSLGKSCFYYKGENLVQRKLDRQLNPVERYWAMVSGITRLCGVYTGPDEERFVVSEHPPGHERFHIDCYYY